MAFVIAVDGPAASGKGTVASRLAALYGYEMLDTGLLYRAVGVRLLNTGGDLDDAVAAEAAAKGLDLSELEKAEVRREKAEKEAARLAAEMAAQDEVDAAKRAARKERKQLTKEEQKAARDARYAARKARQR